MRKVIALRVLANTANFGSISYGRYNPGRLLTSLADYMYVYIYRTLESNFNIGIQVLCAFLYVQSAVRNSTYINTYTQMDSFTLWERHSKLSTELQWPSRSFFKCENHSSHKTTQFLYYLKFAPRFKHSHARHFCIFEEILCKLSITSLESIPSKGWRLSVNFKSDSRPQATRH